jgi:hypothetical protein
MRSIIIAHLIIWAFMFCALVPFYMMAADAMSACQVKHSYSTCVTVLR